MNILSIVFGLLFLSVLMILHELGHFLAGKALGFKIISFNIFMGPILWQHRGKDGVLYALRLFPIGASVEFAGEDSGINEDPENPGSVVKEVDPDDPGLFYNRPRGKRAIVIFMGPAINFITAIIAFAILFSSFGVVLPVVGELEQDSIAAESGLTVGDKIISYNGDRIYSAIDFSMTDNFDRRDENHFVVQSENGEKKDIYLSTPMVERYQLGVYLNQDQNGKFIISEVQDNPASGETVFESGDEILNVNGRPFKDISSLILQEGDEPNKLNVSLKRDGKTIEKTFQAKVVSSRQPLGFYLSEAEGLGQKLGQSFVYPLSIIKSTFKGFSLLFSGAISPEEGLTGPVGIVNMVGGVVNSEQSSSAKFEQLLKLFGLISVAIGFTNLLPIPPFDGFQLLVIGVESLRGKDLSLKLKERMAMVGFVIIIALTILVFYLDISKLFG